MSGNVERRCENCRYYKKCLEWNCLKNAEECEYFEPVNDSS